MIAVINIKGVCGVRVTRAVSSRHYLVFFVENPTKYCSYVGGNRTRTLTTQYFSFADLLNVEQQDRCCSFSH